MNKIKVGFEVTDNWSKGDFREFIQALLRNPNYDVYIISNNDTSSYIYYIGEQLRLPVNRVIITNFTDDKVDAIVENGINIYLDNLQMVVLKIQETTDCEAILVNELPNKYYAKPTYQVEFDRVIKKISDEEESGGKTLEICD